MGRTFVIAGKRTRGRTVDERLDSFTKKDGGCWLWMGCLRNGYGVLMVSKKAEYAHRLSYERFRGSIPAGLDIDHLCRNRACVNPDHLEPVTRGENVRRSPITKPGMIARGIEVGRNSLGRFA